MTNPARSEDLLALYDRAPLDRRYWTIFSLLAIGIALDFFDFFIVSYLVAVVGPQWHLTYGQSAAMLLSGGVGAILGALAWGSLSDAWGRKKLLVAGTFICAAGSGAIALVPDGDWLLFTALRFVVGVGLAGCATPITTLIVELTPTRHRTFITGLLVVFATVGSFIAALVAATLLGFLGWRGVAAIGVVPAVMGVLFIFLLPESARWLVAKGRFAEAQATVARTLGLPLAQVPLPAAKPAGESGHSIAELLARPRFFWLTVITWTGVATAAYGIYLWGPTIIALLLKIPVAQAAHYFVYVALAGIIGKVLLSWLAQKIGRKRVGEIQGYVSAVGLIVAGLCFPLTIEGFPVFILGLVATVLFLEGGASNLAPSSSRSMGCAWVRAPPGCRRRRTASARSWGRSASRSSPAPTIRCRRRRRPTPYCPPSCSSAPVRSPSGSPSPSWASRRTAGRSPRTTRRKAGGKPSSQRRAGPEGRRLAAAGRLSTCP
ncbi:MAG TPA: MFS transporter [Reyranella sp.]|nr:MFS transporter [Reyranella sp.]